MKNKVKNRVLVIDDEPVNIVALRQILTPEYDVYGVKDGATGVVTARQQQPDVILLDILMPEMDGFEVLSSLKSTEETRDIPVIFVTGLSSEGYEGKALDLGADDYIEKPFSDVVVKLRVQNILKVVNRTRTINERLRQQALMAKISHSFLTDSDIESMFTETLRTVGEFMDISQVLLLKYDEEEHVLLCRNEWLDPILNIETRLGDLFVLDEAVVSMISNLLATNEGDFCLHSNDPAVKHAMEPYRKHFNNYIMTPIFQKGKMCAVLDFSKEDDGEDWSESEIGLAVLVSGVFSGVFERHAIERDLNIVLKLKSELIAAKELAEHNRDLAERSSRAKSEFLSRMSHEMLTPMNAIIGMTQIAKISNSLDKTKSYIEKIDASAKHLVTMMHNVLDVSSGSSAFSLSESRFLISAMLEYILRRMAPDINKKHQTLSLDISQAIPETLYGDEKRITQVIVHLLANAIKFSPSQSEILLGAYIHEDEDDTLTLRIEVKDNGIGISEEQQRGLFELFEQADGSRTRKFGGIGIGLALSKCIVELMGGEICVESELGKGAKFTFTCKLKR